MFPVSQSLWTIWGWFYLSVLSVQQPKVFLIYLLLKTLKLIGSSVQLYLKKILFSFQNFTPTTLTRSSSWSNIWSRSKNKSIPNRIVANTNCRRNHSSSNRMTEKGSDEALITKTEADYSFQLKLLVDSRTTLW
jgi:hypothetical protein